MKYAIDSFNQLQDFASYVTKSYLNHSLSSSAIDQITYLNGALSFLLDRSLFKENAGKDLTSEVEETMLVNYDKNKLLELAISIKNQISNDSFLKENDSFSKYYSFIVETEKYVPSALLDEYGKLTLIYLKILSSLVEVDSKTSGLDPLKINEVIFLNGTYQLMLILKGFLGNKFISLKSFPFFDQVSYHAEIIRTNILD